MRIHRKVEYALMALRYMKDKGDSELTSAREVCQSTGGSFDGVARVMQTLAQENLLESTQGVQGGYRLSQPLDQVSLYSLTKALLGPTGLAKCLNGEEACELSPQCNIKPPLRRLDELQTQFYKNVKISDLFSPKKQTEEVTTHPPVTASPLDERRGEVCRRGVFSTYRPKAYFSYVGGKRLGGKRRGRQQSLSPRGEPLPEETL